MFLFRSVLFGNLWYKFQDRRFISKGKGENFNLLISSNVAKIIPTLFFTYDYLMIHKLYKQQKNILTDIKFCEDDTCYKFLSNLWMRQSHILNADDMDARLAICLNFPSNSKLITQQISLKELDSAIKAWKLGNTAGNDGIFSE